MRYGFNSFGGPLAHVAQFKDNFVVKLKWISNEKFLELFALCQTLPGPTSTQLIIAMGSLFTQSTFGGIAGFLVFSVPSATIMLLFGILFDYAFQINFAPPHWLSMLLHGFQSATVSVIASACIQLGQTYIDYPLYILIIAVSCTLFMIFQNVFIMLIMMACGGITSYFLGKENQKPEIQAF